MYCKNQRGCCRSDHVRHGFSLMELMVVIVIIGLLAGAATVSVRGYLATARAGVAKTEIVKIVDGLETYSMVAKRYPSQEEGLEVLMKPIGDFSNGILKRKKLNDPWGNPYEYILNESGEEPFEVVCAGPDGRNGTRDDISSLSIEGDDQ